MAIVAFSPLRDDAVPETARGWLPLRPRSDVAVMLGARATSWSPKDCRTGSSYERCCHGAERFLAYVLGDADGVAEDPGVGSRSAPASRRTDRALARRMAERADARHGR